MKALINLVLGLAGLVEAEVRGLNRGLVKTGLSLVLVGVVFALLVFTLGLWAFALFWGIRTIGWSWAALITGVVTLAGALVAWRMIRWRSK